MIDRDYQIIFHIMTYCVDIARSIERFGTDYNTFMSDKDYFNSVSMCLMQIGELSGRLSDEFKDSTQNQIPWGLVRNMRHRFAHAYDSMEINTIWETATEDIPHLHSFCKCILNQEPPPCSPN